MTVAHHISKTTLFFQGLSALALVCAAIQLSIDVAQDNLFSVLFCTLSSLLTLQYLKVSRSTVTHPMSSLAILGLCITTQYTSLIAQTLYGYPLVKMLREPLVTFGGLAIVQAIAVASHWVYRHVEFFDHSAQSIRQYVLRPMGVFDKPLPVVIWPMAAIGALSLLSGDAAMGDVSGKFFQALSFFAWLPFVIPYLQARSKSIESNGHSRVQSFALIAYVVVLVGVGLARNARQYMLIGPTTGLLIYLLLELQRSQRVTRTTVTKLLATGAIGAFSVLALADLATAMVLARDKRETLSAVQMVQETFDALSDRNRIDFYRQNVAFDAKIATYDEVYLENPILARFSETKFHDNMAYFATRLSDEDKDEFKKVLLEKIWVIAPQSVLDWFDMKIKKERYTFSMGDYYRYFFEGWVPLGSFSTGSIWADFYVVFDRFAPFAISACLILCFLAFDTLSDPTGGAGPSVVILAISWYIFIYGLGGESLPAKVLLLLRDLPQKILLYVLFYQAVRFVLGLMGIPSRAQDKRTTAQTSGHKHAA